MKRLKLATLMAVATVALSAAFAPTAFATPSKTTACTGCHSGAAIAVTASLVSTSTTTAVYNVSVPSSAVIAVFNGATKIASYTGTSTQFSLPMGGTYKIYAVKGPTTGSGIGQTTVSPGGVVVASPVVWKLTRMAPTASILTYTRRAGRATFTLRAKLTKPGSIAVQGVRVILQQRRTTTAAWATAYNLTSSASGTVAKTITKTTKGIWYYRWRVVKTATHTGPYTTAQKVTIK